MGADAVAELAGGSGAGGESTAGDAASRTRALEHLIAQLSEAQRAVITLFYYEDQSVEQVAAVLGMPTGTVKTHLSRARAALREAWLRRTREDAT